MNTNEMNRELGGLAPLFSWLDSHPMTWYCIVILGSLTCAAAIIFHDFTTL